MRLEVLVATMHQEDHTLLDKMNINSDAIIINQCDRHDLKEFEHRGNVIKFFSFAERGVGLNRNNALLRATGDICLFADDDLIYECDYEQKILNAFQDTPQADVIIFNISSSNDKYRECENTKRKRLHMYNSLRYATYRIAARTKKIHGKNLCFSLLFGGGAKYSAGEDTLFMIDCFRKGLKIYASPELIGAVRPSQSTWFRGYTEKFFVDKGAFFHYMSKRWAKLLCLQFIIRKRRIFYKEMHWRTALMFMIRGVNEAIQNV